MSSSNQLLILDKRLDVDVVASNPTAYQGWQWVAMTAEACDRLDALGLPYRAIYECVDASKLSQWDDQVSRDTYQLLCAFENYLIEQRPSLVSDRGFLTGQAYYFHYVISMVLTRVYLIDQLIRSSQAQQVVYLSDSLDPWLDPTIYQKNPWWTILEPELKKRGIQLDVRSRETPYSSQSKVRFSSWGRFVVKRIKQIVKISLTEWRLAQRSATSSRCRKILFARNATYDWQSVVQRFLSLKGTHAYELLVDPYEMRPWMTSYLPRFRELGKWSTNSFSFSMPEEDLETVHFIHSEAGFSPIALEYVGYDLFPAIKAHLVQLACDSLMLSRHSTHVAERALDTLQPDAVCFASIVDSSSVRLAQAAQRRGIPVFCYQHGGCYGTHLNPQHELIEFAHADYFFTYGTGIQYRQEPIQPQRAQLVPVGSARIQSFISRVSHSSCRTPVGPRVLWISEVSFWNALGGTFLIDDTRRYALECQALRVLADIPNVQVTYRPFPGQESWNGTSHWIERKKIPTVTSESRSSMLELYDSHDLIVIVSSSNTTWNEVLALHKPCLIFADPHHTRFQKTFQEDLKKLGCWYPSEETFVEALRQFAVAPYAFLNQLMKNRPDDLYVKRYVLHEEGDIPARVLKLINDLPSHQQGKQKSHD